MNHSVSIYHGFEYRPLENGQVIESMVFAGLDSNWPKAEGYRLAYSYQSEYGADSLERIYRENNAVDGWEINVKNQARSLSVGDVVEVDGAWYGVASMGFAPADGAYVQEHIVDYGPEDGVAFAEWLLEDEAA